MSVSGQMPSDYGMHWTGSRNWDDYGPCGCGAGPASPCLDRRIKHLPPRAMWTVHRGRQNFVSGETT